MDEKELKYFANWLWDMGLLKVENQIPPFPNAEYWADQYIKVRKLNILDVSKSLCPKCESEKVHISYYYKKINV